MKKDRGFTLMELVVVVSIISILAGIVTPKVRLALIKSKDVKIEGDLEAVRTASNLYYNERNRALGKSDATTGSGVPQGDELDYTPYNETTKAKAVTVAHIKELIEKKYLERNAAKLFIKNTTSDRDSIKFLPGTNMAKIGNCSLDRTPLDSADYSTKEVYLVFDSDLVGISLWDGQTKVANSIEDGLVDSGCNPWNIK